MTICCATLLVISLLSLTGVVHTASVSIIAPDADQEIDVSPGESVSLEVTATNVQSYTWVTDPDDGSFSFTENYPSLNIQNAGELSAGVYRITITAHGTDGTSTGVRIITYTVAGGNTETNQHTPQFTALQGPIKIVEDANTGTNVLNVTATDADTASPDNEISYSIDGTDFAINATFGLITLETALNYSLKSEYELIITATDGGSTPKSASITATVSVQTRPTWSHPSPDATVTKNVSETTQSLDIITFVATDEDGSDSFVYVFDQVPGEPMFEMINDTLYTKSDANFDVDADGTHTSYTLTFRLSDGEYFSTSTVKIQVDIRDENDNTPEFDPPTYVEDVPEYASQGASVLNVTACDDDLSSPNNDIEYNLADTSAFVIDATTGLIKVATPSTLNYTAKSVHELIVIATDGGNPKLSASTTVTISLWTRPSWLAPLPERTATKTIPEGMSSSEQIYLLEAKDDDNSGALEYSLLSQEPNTPVMFVVNGSSLKQKPNVDFDVDAADAVRSYTLTLRVTDGTNMAEADAVINVTVTDINDNTPVFDPSEYNVTITDDWPAGTSVLTVTALDADFSDVNKQVSYSLQDTSTFVINSTSGIISVGSPSTLNYDDSPYYDLVVLATDSGDPIKSASVTATIGIETKPVWTKPPSAQGQGTVIEIPENTTASTTIFTLVAEDKDNIPAPLQYSLVSQVPETPALFIVDGDTVKTTSGADFDVDSANAILSFNLTFRVYDGQYTVDAQLEVSVTGVNDSPPSFEGLPYLISIPEHEQAGSSVISVSASDNDYFHPNYMVTYRLQDTSAFEIDDETGDISVVSPSILDYTTNHTHEFIAIATDGGYPANTDTASVTISLLTGPVWTNHFTEKQITELDQPGSMLYRLNATDEDNSATLNYTILSQTTTLSLFVIEDDMLKTAPGANFDLDVDNAEAVFYITIRFVKFGLSLFLSRLNFS